MSYNGWNVFNRSGQFLSRLAQTAEQLSVEAIWAIILSVTFVQWLRGKVLELAGGRITADSLAAEGRTWDEIVGADGSLNRLNLVPGSESLQLTVSPEPGSLGLLVLALCRALLLKGRRSRG